MKIDTILFDLDGTLVQHSHVLLPEKLAEWGHARPAPWVAETFSTEIHWFYDYAAELQARGQDTPLAWQRVWPMFYRRIARQLEIDDAAIVDKMIEFFADEPTPPLFDDALPLLEKLAEDPWRLGVITQRGRVGATRFLRDHGLLDRFHIIVAGDDGYGRKPAPDPFHHALGYLKGHPERAIFVGDRIDDDCGGACSAGLRAFLIDRTGVHLATEPDTALPRFTHLSSLIDLLDHLPQPHRNGDGHNG